jgi:four helix bundle protein
MVAPMENKETKYGDFRDLEVWQLCKSIRVEIWNLCKSFPKEEKYRLSDQMIRSSRSATDCIAEGYGRYHYQENIQFCRQARGSLFELMNQLGTALECEYIDQNYFDEMIEKIKNAIRVLNGYINYLRNRKKENSKKNN